MNTARARVLAVALFSIAGGLQSLQAASPIVVDSAWIREAPPGSPVLAAYMVISNTRDNAQRITGIQSPDFKSAEIHRTVVEEDIARMLPVAQLEVPAHSSVSLEPGGLHVMLFEPQRLLREGDSATLIIHTADDSVSVQATVVRKTGGVDHSHHLH